MTYKNNFNRTINILNKKKAKLIIKKNFILFSKSLIENKSFNFISFDKYLIKLYKLNKISRIKKKFFLNLKKLFFF